MFFDKPAPSGSFSCGPRNSWESFTEDVGWQIWRWLSDPIIGIAVIAAFGCLIVLVARQTKRDDIVTNFTAMALIAVTSATVTAIMATSHTFRTSALAGLAGFFATGGALTLAQAVKNISSK